MGEIQTRYHDGFPIPALSCIPASRGGAQSWPHTGSFRGFQFQHKFSPKLGLPSVPLKLARWQSQGGLVTHLSGKPQAYQGSTWGTKTETKSNVVPPATTTPKLRVQGEKAGRALGRASLSLASLNLE